LDRENIHSVPRLLVSVAGHPGRAVRFQVTCVKRTNFIFERRSARKRVLKIRLRRTGARKRPSYRIVVAESTAPRDGKYVEIIGTYDPLTEPATIKLDGDRAKHWISVGAQPTERVVKLMAREGLVEAPAYASAAAKTDSADEADAE
jgi:small subunit ribosomal protein S16